jgi:hypothetical protein
MKLLAALSTLLMLGACVLATQTMGALINGVLPSDRSRIVGLALGEHGQQVLGSVFNEHA